MLAAPLDLDEAAGWFNARIAGLDLEPVQLVELVRHAKSNKVGVFVDGAPRTAGHFPALNEPGTRPDLIPERPVASDIDTVAEESPAAANASLSEVIEAFADAVGTAGVVFRGANHQLPRAFLAAVVAKRFAILSGLSGSGKTQLARAFGQWLGADDHGARYLVVPVRPDWTSPEPLLGYEDALLKAEQGRPAWTVPAALEFMLRAQDDAWSPLPTRARRDEPRSRRAVLRRRPLGDGVGRERVAVGPA